MTDTTELMQHIGCPHCDGLPAGRKLSDAARAPHLAGHPAGTGVAVYGRSPLDAVAVAFATDEALGALLEGMRDVPTMRERRRMSPPIAGGAPEPGEEVPNVMRKCWCWLDSGMCQVHRAAPAPRGPIIAGGAPEPGELPPVRYRARAVRPLRECEADDCDTMHSRRSPYCGAACVARVRYRADPAYRRARIEATRRLLEQRRASRGQPIESA